MKNINYMFKYIYFNLLKIIMYISRMPDVKNSINRQIMCYLLQGVFLILEISDYKSAKFAFRLCYVIYFFIYLLMKR